MNTLSINGTSAHVEAAPDTPLLWVLRDTLQMTGTKYGCGMGLCGACTIHLDGQPVRSCVPPVAPGVANAVFAATGKRLQRLPFAAEALKA